MVLLDQRIAARVVFCPGIAAGEPAHHRGGEEEAVAERPEALVVRQRSGDRVDRHLRQDRDGGGLGAQRRGDDDRQVAAGAVAHRHEAGDLEAQFGGAAGDPPRGRLAIVGRGGEGVLGREAVIDRDHRQPGLGGDLAAEAGVGIEVADDEPAAVEEHDRRPRAALGLRVEQPQRDRPRPARAGEIADDRQLTRRSVGELAHGARRGARLVERQFVDLRPVLRLQEVEKGAHVVAHVMIGLAHVRSHRSMTSRAGRAFHSAISVCHRKT